MKLSDLCRAVYPSCKKIKSQYMFIELLFTAAGDGIVSESYGKQFFSGRKPFGRKQRMLFRGKAKLEKLKEFFETNIDDTGIVLQALGIPEKGEPNKNALSLALAQQMMLLIDSDEEDTENILILQYQQAKQSVEVIETEYVKPLYSGDAVSVLNKCSYEIQSYETITHTWELYNSGNVTWIGRKLVYKRGPKDRPEANPDTIIIPEVLPKECTKITTTIDGRGFDGVTHCIWEMQDSDGENCFPERKSLFSVTIDAIFKRYE